MLWLLQILSSTHPLDTVVERCVNWNNKYFCEFFFFSEEHLLLPVNFPARQRFSLVLAAYHIRAFPSYHGSLRLSFQCRSQGLSSSCPVDLLSLQSAKKRDPANEVVVGCSRQENEMIQNWACFRFFFALGLKLHNIFLFRPTKTYMQRSCRTQRIWNEFLGGRNVVNFRSSGIVASYE